MSGLKIGWRMEFEKTSDRFRSSMRVHLSLDSRKRRLLQKRIEQAQIFHNNMGRNIRDE